jgi:hypothetical protein
VTGRFADAVADLPPGACRQDKAVGAFTPARSRRLQLMAALAGPMVGKASFSERRRARILAAAGGPSIAEPRWKRRPITRWQGWRRGQPS